MSSKLAIFAGTACTVLATNCVDAGVRSGFSPPQKLGGKGLLDFIVSVRSSTMPDDATARFDQTTFVGKRFSVDIPILEVTDKRYKAGMEGWHYDPKSKVFEIKLHLSRAEGSDFQNVPLSARRSVRWVVGYAFLTRTKTLAQTGRLTNDGKPYLVKPRQIDIFVLAPFGRYLGRAEPEFSKTMSLADAKKLQKVLFLHLEGTIASFGESSVVGCTYGYDEGSIDEPDEIYSDRCFVNVALTVAQITVGRRGRVLTNIQYFAK